MTNRKIKVVFGVNDFLIGGVQRQFVRQLEFFDRDRFEIVLITLYEFSGEHTLYDELPSNLEVYRLAFRSMFDFENWWRLYRLLSRIKPDIVISSLFDSNMIFRVLKSFVGYVAIAREHNTYTSKPLWQRLIDRMLASCSYRIVAVSQTVAEFTAAQEHISSKRFSVIHNGIDAEQMIEQFRTMPEATLLKEREGFNPTDKVLIVTSRLVPQKNHHLLIDGFAAFHRTHPDYRLAVVGEGPLLAELEQKVKKLDMSGSILFFSRQDDRDTFYRLADAFVSTSDIEGLSNSMLKALAAGVPIIATKTAGTDEILEDGINGFFIEKATIDEVAEVLEKFAKSDSGLLKKNALLTVGRFDIKMTVEKYSALFIESLNRK